MRDADLAVRGRLCRSDPVDRPPVGHRHDPGGGRPAARLEPGRRAPHLHQHLLCDLLGLRRIPQDPADDAEHLAADPLVEPFERVVVPVGDPLDQQVQRRSHLRRRPGVGHRTQRSQLGRHLVGLS